jgi:hypothetical protein
MKYLLIIALTVSHSVLSAQKYLKVIEATSHQWAGGMPQSGSGVEYRVIIKLLTNTKVNFNDIWIGQLYGKPEIRNKRNTKDGEVIKGDTIILSYNDRHIPPQYKQNTDKLISKKVPYSCSGAALIGYNIQKMHKYITIKEFKKLPASNYP